jgi:DnaJ family protein C protein 11
MVDQADERSYYALLGVAPTASEEEVRRAFRQLATTLHPDKVANSAQHDEAATLFTQIQEAYEILSDPQKRDIYDVYGKEGLTAGLQLGDRLKTRDELRAEWEAFQKKQKKEALEASVNYRGVYIFKVDATALVSPYMPSLPRTPELTSIYMTSGLDVPLESKDWGWLASEQDVAHLGGLVNVRKNVGGGSFLAGYKRHFADYSSFEVHGAVGLRTLLSAQHSVQLTPESSASLVASWQPHVGLGLQFVSQRQLSSTLNGEYSWVVGPPEAAGMSLGLTRRTEKTMLSGRLEVSGGKSHWPQGLPNGLLLNHLWLPVHACRWAALSSLHCRQASTLLAERAACT